MLYSDSKGPKIIQNLSYQPEIEKSGTFVHKCQVKHGKRGADMKGYGEKLTYEASSIFL